MSRVIVEFATDVNNKVSGLQELINKLQANGKIEKQFTCVDLRNATRGRWGGYGYLATGGHLKSLVNRGILTVVGKEKYTVTFEENDYNYRDTKVFIDVESGAQVDHYNMKEGRNYKVKIIPAGDNMRTYTFENERNIYKLNAFTVENVKNLMLEQVANKIENEYKRVK